MKKVFLTLIVAFCALTACASSNARPDAPKTEDELLAQWTARLDSLSKVLDAAAPEQREQALKVYEDAVLQCCRENMQSTFPGDLLLKDGFCVDKGELAKLAEQNPKWINEGKLARMKDRILAWKSLTLGAPVTDFVMADITGTERHLKDLIQPGHCTLIDFWASWCGPCRADMPQVKALYEKYHAKGLDIIGVSLDSKHDAWVNAINTVAGGLPWQHISDLKGWDSVGATTYGVMFIPFTVFIGPDGNVVAYDMSDDKLKSILKKYYGE